MALELSEAATSRARASVASQGVQLLALTLAASAGVYARTALSPLQERMRVAMSLTDNDMALLQGPALALPLILAAIPIGLLIDRTSRVRLLIGFAALTVLGSISTALASNFALIFAARCVVGLATTAIGTAAFSLVADFCAPAQRGRATLLLAIGQYAGSSAAFALGGTLLAHLGSRPDAWQTAMLWSTVPAAAVVIVLFAMREPPRHEQSLCNPSTREAFAGVWQHRVVILPLLSGLVLVEVALQSALVWSAPSLTRRFDLAPDRVGAIMATALMVSGIAGPIAGGVLADLAQSTRGPRMTLAILSVLALLTAPFATFGLVPAGVSVISSALLIFMTTITALLVMGTALFTVVVPNELRGLCMSLFASATLIFGVGMGPLGVSMLSTGLGGATSIGRALAVVAATACMLATVCFATASRWYAGARASSAHLRQ